MQGLHQKLLEIHREQYWITHHHSPRAVKADCNWRQGARHLKGTYKGDFLHMCLDFSCQYGPVPGPWRAGKFNNKYFLSNTFFQKVVVFDLQTHLFNGFNLLLSFLAENGTERLWNYLKNSVSDPKRGKFDQRSSFWHLVSVSWGWGNPQGGSGETLEGQTQSQPWRSCMITL